MQINISEILSNPSVEKKYNVDIEASAIRFKGRKFPITEKTPFTLEIRRSRDIISLQTQTTVKLVIPCDRCLDDVEFTFPIAIDLEFKASELSDGAKDEDELLFIEGCMLDVDKLISDEVVVALPTKVLCREDCKGLCSVCGTNLNHGSCQCDREVLDPRMAAIKDIFQNFHEE